MKHDCSVVCDLLPLYLEEMVSPETEDDIKAHLKNCPDCAAKLERLAKPGKAENIIAQKNKDNSCAVADFKTVKKRMKRKITVWVCLSAFLALIIFLFCNDFWPPTIDYRTSEVYTKEEIGEVIALIKYRYRPETKMRLYSVTYLGDDASERELAYINSEKRDDVTYVGCMVFGVEYRSSPYAGGALLPYTRNHLFYRMVRTKDGGWKIYSVGTG